MLHTAVADWAAFKLYEAIMAFYNPAAKEAILYYAPVSYTHLTLPTTNSV